MGTARLGGHIVLCEVSRPQAVVLLTQVFIVLITYSGPIGAVAGEEPAFPLGGKPTGKTSSCW